MAAVESGAAPAREAGPMAEAEAARRRAGARVWRCALMSRRPAAAAAGEWGEGGGGEARRDGGSLSI